MNESDAKPYPRSWDYDEPRFKMINPETMDHCACGTWKDKADQDCGLFCKLNIAKRLGR